jgi:hypothetical protein
VTLARRPPAACGVDIAPTAHDLMDMSDRPSSETWPDLDGEFARAVVRDAMHRYFAARRERIAPFVDHHFTLTGSLVLHRRALGWDLLRAPANLLLAVPNAGAKLVAAGLDAAGAKPAGKRLRTMRLLMETDVAREIRRLLVTELLELPWPDGRGPGCGAGRDALAETVLADPRVEAFARRALAAVAGRAGDADFRRRLEETVATYAETRAAAAEITTALVTLGTGAAAVHQVTPGAMTLGPALAAAIAQQSAIASFPLGSTLGSLWYGVFPAAASSALVAGLTGGLMLGAAALSAFAGVVSDPVQRRLGLHRRRLERLLAALEREWIEGVDGTFIVRDHYAARLVDLLDLLAGAWRLART